MRTIMPPVSTGTIFLPKSRRASMRRSSRRGVVYAHGRQRLRRKDERRVSDRRAVRKRRKVRGRAARRARVPRNVRFPQRDCGKSRRIRNGDRLRKGGYVVYGGLYPFVCRKRGRLNRKTERKARPFGCAFCVDRLAFFVINWYNRGWIGARGRCPGMRVPVYE